MNLEDLLKTSRELGVGVSVVVTQTTEGTAGYSLYLKVGNLSYRSESHPTLDQAFKECMVDFQQTHSEFQEWLRKAHGPNPPKEDSLVNMVAELGRTLESLKSSLGA